MKELNMRDEEFTKIMERVKNIDGLVENMEDNNDSLAQDFQKFEMEITELDKTKETNHPLNKLTDLLDKWNREEI